MENSVCPKCGKDTEGSMWVCKYCGASLSATAQEEITDQAAAAPALLEVAPPRKSHKKLWILLGVIAGLFIVIAIIFSSVLVDLKSEARPISALLDNFLKNMAVKDVESAHDLFEPSAQAQITVANLTSIVTGSNFQALEGYQSLTLTNIRKYFGSPERAEVSGTLTYSPGSGEFTATVIKVNGAWMMLGFDVKKYLPTQP